MRRLQIVSTELAEALVVRILHSGTDGTEREIRARGVTPSTCVERKLTIGDADSGTKKCDLTVNGAQSIRSGDVFLYQPNADLTQLISGDVDEETSLVVTNQCNFTCIMCPQSAVDLPGHHQINLRALESGPEGLKCIGLTGGEPTLPRKQFFELARACRARYPNAVVSVLTNGVLLADKGYVEEIASELTDHVTFHIPLYADNPIVHDTIVGGPGFYRSIRAMYNIYSHGFPVEVRYVLMRQNVARLEQTADYIGRTVPFATHVAFMGVELEGAARGSEAAVWIDPNEYMAPLKRAMNRLERQGLTVSMYNLPLCVIPPDMRRYSRKAISPWKVAFAACCAHCEARNACGGYFESTRHRYSRLVAPIVVGEA